MTPKERRPIVFQFCYVSFASLVLHCLNCLSRVLAFVTVWSIHCLFLLSQFSIGDTRLFPIGHVTEQQANAALDPRLPCPEYNPDLHVLVSAAQMDCLENQQPCAQVLQLFRLPALFVVLQQMSLHSKRHVCVFMSTPLSRPAQSNSNEFSG